MRALAIQLVPILAIRLLFDGMQGFLQGVIRGLGLQKYSSLIALVVSYPLLLVLAMILTFEFDMGLTGIWLADLVGMLVQTIIFVLYIKHSNWTEITRKTVARLDQEKREL